MLKSYDLELPEHFTLRLLNDSDYYHQYIELLGHLTDSPMMPFHEFREIRRRMKPDMGYYPLVVYDSSCKRVVANVTLIIEQKLIHGGSKVGHIEDVVVHLDYRGRRLAHKLLEVAKDICRKKGCYKVMLDCSSDLVEFYEKVEFDVKGAMMRYDIL